MKHSLLDYLKVKRLRVLLRNKVDKILPISYDVHIHKSLRKTFYTPSWLWRLLLEHSIDENPSQTQHMVYSGNCPNVLLFDLMAYRTWEGADLTSQCETGRVFLVQE